MFSGSLEAQDTEAAWGQGRASALSPGTVNNDPVCSVYEEEVNSSPSPQPSAPQELPDAHVDSVSWMEVHACMDLPEVVPVRGICLRSLSQLAVAAHASNLST